MTIPKIIINLSLALALFSSGNAEQPDLKPKNNVDLELNIFKGHRSFLLSWSFNDTIDIKSIHVKTKKSIDSDFEVVEVFDDYRDRYLLNNCEPGARYFFIVEIYDHSGKIFSSDRITPIFGTCVDIKDYQEWEGEFLTVSELIGYKVFSGFSESNSSYEIKQILDLLIKSDSIEIAWLESAPYELVLKELNKELIQIDKVIKSSELPQRLIREELLYRNIFLLTTDEWLEIIHSELAILIGDWNILFNKYLTSYKLISELPVIRLLGVNPLLDGHKEIALHIIHKEKINVEQSYLLYQDEYLNIGDFLIDDKEIISVKVPDDWFFADMILNDFFYQKIPLWIPFQISNSIHGDLVPTDDIFSIKIKSDSVSTKINEMAWLPKYQKLDIESYGSLSFDEKYSVSVAEKIIWELSWDPGSTDKHKDSTFFLEQNINLPQLLSWNIWDDDRWKPIEYIILDTLAITISRFPDGGIWENSRNTTLGFTNNPEYPKINDALVPELFILYQNYPNPFNGLTRLTFDLLEDAIITLYVTDAKGRVWDVFVENKSLNVGTYNYEWSGENRSTGIYFFTIQAKIENYPPAIMSRKMIYLK
mgnify:CR=1 FL=1|tara:strand:+ start:13731 stop:15506 length:1776 start_codon:yes stop_codon:yes gene_type:complete